MGGIFINYRQNDVGGARRAHVQAVEAIADRLTQHFGPSVVFLDTRMRTATRYPDELRKRLQDSEVVVAVLHTQWVDDLKARGSSDGDWVRNELRTAFATGKPVVPVILDGAGQPSAPELSEFSDIAELTNRQSWRIRFGHWEADIRHLIDVLETHVSITPLVEESEEKERRAPLWAVWLTALLGLAVPWLVTRLLVSDPMERTGALIGLALGFAFLTFISLGITSLGYLNRRWMDGFDDNLAQLSHDTTTSIIVGLTVAGLATTLLFTTNQLNEYARSIMLVIIVMTVVTLGDRWLRDRRRAEVWPKEWLSPTPASVRGALARTARHFDEHQPMLTRHQRDQAVRALDQVDKAVGELRTRCALSRRSWLSRLGPFALLVHTVVFAVVIGTTAGALWEGGGLLWPLLVGTAGVSALFLLGAFEFGYRLQRWQKQVVVDVAPDQAKQLRTRLDEISNAPRA